MMLRHKRYDTRVVRMAGCRVEVYWRADELGCGPCLSVYIGKYERLRFDLFDPAHMHFGNVMGSPRHYYPAGLTRAEYVALALEDLSTHCPKVERCKGWAAQQLLEVTGPATPAPRPTRRPVKLPHGLRAR